MSTPIYWRFQVKSSGKWLKILNSNTAGQLAAGQGSLPIDGNYLWGKIDSAVPGYSAVDGYSLIQLMSSSQYLCIPDGEEVNTNGTVACQKPLPDQPDPNAAPPLPDNYLWKIQSDTSNPGWSTIQVKNNTPLYLNIHHGSKDDDAEACQGAYPTTGSTTNSNFLWIVTSKEPTNVIVTMKILNCASVYLLKEGTISTADADLYLLMKDDNNGELKGPDQSSFETILNAGSMITWQPIIESATGNNGYEVAITGITCERGGNNVLGPAMLDNGTVIAQVLWTSIPLDGGDDNESYTITFTVDNGASGPRTYSIDPKIKINPST